MEYKPRGSITIAINTDRQTYGLKSAVEGHAGNNEGSIESISVDENLITLGPCLEETLDIPTAQARVAQRGDFARWFAEMVDPDIRRYTLLDGQRLIFAISENAPAILFQDSHASFGNEQWRDAFPEEVWE